MRRSSAVMCSRRLRSSATSSNVIASAASAARVVSALRPGREALLREPADVAPGREAGQERQRDLAVELVEQSDHARVDQLQVGAQLVVGRPVAAFDRDPIDLVAVRRGDQIGRPGRGVRDAEPGDRGPGVVAHAHGVLGPRPVHPAHRTGPATSSPVLSPVVSMLLLRPVPAGASASVLPSSPNERSGRARLPVGH